MIVQDLAGFNSVENPGQEDTHIFECASGYFICKSPQQGDRYKYQQVLRKAHIEEIIYFSVVTDHKKRIILEELEGAYNLATTSHINSILDQNQGLPCDVLPMGAALAEAGFSDDEISLLESSKNEILALSQIVQQRDL